MKNTKSIWVVAVTSALVAVTAFADHNDGMPAGERGAAPANAQPRLTGCIVKDNKGEAVGFDIQIGTERNHYVVKGQTAPDQGIYRTDSDYGGIKVLKHSIDNGLTRLEEIQNSGKAKIYPRKRKVDGVILAGVPVGGYTVQKLFTNSLTMDKVTASNKASSGKLFYNVLNGRYTCAPGKCKFGDYGISSADAGSNIVLNYDNFLINKNRMRVAMQFGDLQLKGLIKFNDTTKTTIDLDGDSHTQVASTRGCFNVDISKANGAPLNLSLAEQGGTADDVTLRHLIAWLELMSYDLFSE